MENIVISGCNGTSSIFVINPTCTRERPRGTTRLTNVSFEDNGVFDQGHLIEANSSCLQLRMTAVLFVRNRCIGTNCILLGSRTILRDIALENNRGSNATTLESSIFLAVEGSQTIATNMTSSRNELRSFHISSGALNITDSLFIGNGRNESHATRDHSMGGGALLSVHSSISVSNSTFESNYALNGGAIYALESNVSIEDCFFRENNVGSGNGGALYGHDNSSFDITSSMFSRNRAQRGAALHSEETRWLNMVNSMVSENNCSRSGAFLLEHGSAIIRSCNFLRNFADREGGALAVSTVELSLWNSSFVDNEATMGGACYFQSSCIVRGTNLLLDNNRAHTGDGGGIHLASRSRLRLIKTVFRRNNAVQNGGALSAIGGTSMFLERIDFLNNSCESMAGGIYARRGTFKSG